MFHRDAPGDLLTSQPKLYSVGRSVYVSSMCIRSRRFFLLFSLVFNSVVDPDPDSNPD